MKLTSGLSEESLKPVRVYLNLSANFRGYLHRLWSKLNKRRFRTASYSPDAALMAERLTLATLSASFPGQLICPSQLRFFKTYDVFIPAW